MDYLGFFPADDFREFFDGGVFYILNGAESGEEFLPKSRADAGDIFEEGLKRFLPAG
jgi:hypothetical protein